MPLPRPEHDRVRTAPRWPRFDDVRPEILRRNEGAYLTMRSVRRAGWRTWAKIGPAARAIEARAPG